MKILSIFLALTIFSYSTMGFAGNEIKSDDSISWVSIGNLNVGKVAERALNYLKTVPNKLKGAELVVLEVRASYREGRKKLIAVATSKKAMTDGTLHPIMLADGSSIEKYIIFDIVLVSFDDNGNPISSKIMGEKFFGTKEQLKKYLKDK